MTDRISTVYNPHWVFPEDPYNMSFVPDYLKGKIKALQFIKQDIE